MIHHLFKRAPAAGARIFFRSSPVKKLKALMMNPFLIAVQGFMVGAVLLWSGAAPVLA